MSAETLTLRYNQGQLTMRVYLSETTDPWLNLSIEDWLFREMSDDDCTLMLYCNQPSVVIGRFQNPWAECHIPLMQKEGIHLVRRQSGGGTVFHDLGNSNFCFMASNQLYDQKKQSQLVLKALQKLGVKNAQASGRNDLVIDGKKFSGAAFKVTKNKSFHHGTLLLSADLEGLRKYLHPIAKRIQSQAVQSVRSPVTNLDVYVPSIKHEEVCQALLGVFASEYGPIEKVVLDCQLPAIQERYRKLLTWDWCFAETPVFTHELEQTFKWGDLNIQLRCRKAMIEDFQIQSTSFHPQIFEELAKNFIGKEYSVKTVEKVMQQSTEHLPMMNQELIEIARWLKQALI